MEANNFEIRRGNPKFTKYDPSADYSISIPGLPDEVNGGLSGACCRVAKNGSDNKCEALELIDLTTGIVRYIELGEYDHVGGDEFWQFIRDNPDDIFAFVHNHPTNDFLSSTDMETFVTTEQIQAMISTSNDGLKRIAYGDIKDSRLLVDIFKNKVDNLRKQIKDGMLKAVEYPYELQKLLVENAIRDYSNLGFWEVDGRV